MDIVKKIKKKDEAKEVESPLVSLFPKIESEPEEEEEKIEVTQYGKEEAGGTTIMHGFGNTDSRTEDETVLKAEGYRELTLEELGKKPAPAKTTKTIGLTTEDEEKIKYITLIVALLESSQYGPSINTIKEMERECG